MKRLEQPSVAAETAMNQYAALCYRVSAKGRVQVLLITSRDTGRWVLPKGWPMKGHTAGGCALREAFEEAGVRGEVSDHCLGFYSYSKVISPTYAPTCVVAVFPVRVTHLLGKFPERDQRERKWFAPEKAAEKVVEPELRAMLLSFSPATGAGRRVLAG